MLNIYAIYISSFIPMFSGLLISFVSAIMNIQVWQGIANYPKMQYTSLWFNVSQRITVS